MSVDEQDLDPQATASTATTHPGGANPTEPGVGNPPGGHRRPRAVTAVALVLMLGILVVVAYRMIGGASDDSTTTDRSGHSASAIAEADDERVEATLASECVRPGDPQTLRVEGEPGHRVMFQAVYSDGVHGANPNHYGGNAQGITDAEGVFVNDWTVGDGAPDGPVDVQVFWFGDEATVLDLRFAVAQSQEGCS